MNPRAFALAASLVVLAAASGCGSHPVDAGAGDDAGESDSDASDPCPNPMPPATVASFAGSSLPVVTPQPRTATYGTEATALGTAIVCTDCPGGNLQDRLADVATVAKVPLGTAAICDAPHTRVAIHLGVANIAAQGYRLVITPGVFGPEVTIDAADEPGAYYGIVSLGQLIVVANGSPYVRSAQLDDSPSFPRRGAIIDGSVLARTTFAAAYKMNFLYWRIDLTDPDLDKIIAFCKTHYIEFQSQMGAQNTLSDMPLADLQATLKMQFDRGIRSFSLNWDDLSSFDAVAASDNEAGIVKAVYDALRALDPNVSFAVTLPPYGGVPYENLLYSNGGVGEQYLKLMDQKLPPDVDVFWTGDGGVFSTTVTPAAAQKYANVIGRRVLLWDNNPIQFANARQPVSGRAANLPTVVHAYMANMNKFETAWNGTDGQFTLITALMYSWNSGAYDPTKAATIANALVRK